MKSNIDVFDITKFLLSLTIIALHSQLFDPFLFSYLRIAVPVFFILTGYLSFAKLDRISGYSNRKEHLIHIIKRYFKLYLFLFVILLPFTLYIRHYFENGMIMGLFMFLRSLFFWSTFSASWYLMASIIGLCIVFFMSEKFYYQKNDKLKGVSLIQMLYVIEYII